MTTDTAAPAEGHMASSAEADGAVAAGTSPGMAFRFGEPETVLEGRRGLLGYAECRQNGRWWEPPVPMRELARTFRMSPHHSSAIYYKRNQLVRFFEPSRWLSRAEFAKIALNYIAMGNAYVERRDNLAGRPMQLLSAPAKFTRVGVDDGVFWDVPGDRTETAYKAGSVYHLMEDDLEQEIYGVPDYIAALQSGMLNQESTIFRRRYFKNGSHLGYILYVNDANFAQADAAALQEAMKNAKGPGNFRNLFLHLPAGKEKSVQVIPVGEAAAKDEFFNVKNTTRDDVLAGHRIPPVVLGVVPQVAGGFGDVAKASDSVHYTEIEPLQGKMLEINDFLGQEAVSFRPYEPQVVPASAKAA